MSKASESSDELKEDQWLRDFRRALGYVWPRKKLLVWCVLFIVLGAASYSAALGLILPVLKVMVDEEGLHGWAYRLMAEERTGLEFEIYDSRRFRKIPGAPEFCLLVRNVADDGAAGSPAAFWVAELLTTSEIRKQIACQTRLTQPLS